MDFLETGLEAVAGALGADGVGGGILAGSAAPFCFESPWPIVFCGGR